MYTQPIEGHPPYAVARMWLKVGAPGTGVDFLGGKKGDHCRLTRASPGLAWSVLLLRRFWPSM
jgi:hypothetical protein